MGNSSPSTLLGIFSPADDSVDYLLNDQFTVDDPAPLDDPRTCVPGPGQLDLVDTTNKLSTSGGVLVRNGGLNSYTDPLIQGNTSHSRVCGRTLAFKYRWPVAGDRPNTSFITGWSKTKNVLNDGLMFWPSYGSESWSDYTVDGAYNNVWPTQMNMQPANDTDWTGAMIVLRAEGYNVLLNMKERGSTTDEWIHYGFVPLGTDAGPFYPWFAPYQAAVVVHMDNIRVADAVGQWANEHTPSTYYSASVGAGSTFDAAYSQWGFVSVRRALGAGETFDFSFQRTDDDNRFINRIDETGRTAKLIERTGGVETERASWAGGALLSAGNICIVTYAQPHYNSSPNKAAGESFRSSILYRLGANKVNARCWGYAGGSTVRHGVTGCKVSHAVTEVEAFSWDVSVPPNL